ncbi:MULTISPECIES: hypothetical protein [Pseudonocardia]|uniref:Uncharacterized protein n=2 Tax=Pseudonocardia TaxID=1847 RepID=A0A1Y2MTK3_PSEAH|nr:MULTISPECIES: hypothetical protein [Pseudonocardia]OSY38097.1 hypothetical protein BG845_04270 [Pseudonocardia autotrophica]TDN75538.1 hypothetical protein C8E95_4715 [Pseudonocardia autotrophica]BBF99508.1 hypothetical protein Pdca_07180 [Pseudonocardia autotrophica]GEC28509.1 hypothetical protein PSA01_55380 [Pseudonocardia saturnea]
MNVPQNSPQNTAVPAERAESRATPLPEEEGTGAPDRDGAEEILRESEERIAGAAAGDEPAADAEQRRRSEEAL